MQSPARTLETEVNGFFNSLHTAFSAQRPFVTAPNLSPLPMVSTDEGLKVVTAKKVAAQHELLLTVAAFRVKVLDKLRKLDRIVNDTEWVYREYTLMEDERTTNNVEVYNEAQSLKRNRVLENEAVSSKKSKHSTSHKLKRMRPASVSPPINRAAPPDLAEAALLQTLSTFPDVDM